MYRDRSWANHSRLSLDPQIGHADQSLMPPASRSIGPTLSSQRSSGIADHSGFGRHLIYREIVSYHAAGAEKDPSTQPDRSGDDRPRSDRYKILDQCIVADHRSVFDDHMISDDRIGSDDDIVKDRLAKSDFGVGGDRGGGVNDRCEPVSRKPQLLDEAFPHPAVSHRRDPDHEKRRILRCRGNRAEDAHVIDRTADFFWIVVEEPEEVPRSLVAIYVLDRPGDLPRCATCAEDDEILHQ